MMLGGSLGGSWETLPRSGGDDHYDHQHHNHDDPQTYWGKGSRITKPGNNHAPGRSDPFGHSTSKMPPYWEPMDERQYPFDLWYTDLENWCVLTDLAAEKHAAAVGGRLGGTVDQDGKSNVWVRARALGNFGCAYFSGEFRRHAGLRHIS